MKTSLRFRHLVVAAVVLLSVLPCCAQRRRDPLTDSEIDKLRDKAQTPDERLKLWVEFTRARIAAVDQLRGDPKLAADRPQRIHDLLEDLGNMVGEVDDNMSDYAKQRWDIRKELKEVVELSSELQVKLRGLKEVTDTDSQKEQKEYRFVLQDTTEAVNNLGDDARELLDQQNEQAKEKDPAKKLRKIEKEPPARKGH